MYIIYYIYTSIVDHHFCSFHGTKPSGVVCLSDEGGVNLGGRCGIKPHLGYGSFDQHDIPVLKVMIVYDSIYLDKVRVTQQIHCKMLSKHSSSMSSLDCAELCRTTPLEEDLAQDSVQSKTAPHCEHPLTCTIGSGRSYEKK